MTAIRARGYQTECIAAINTDLQTNNRTAAVLATGLGKSAIFSFLASQYVAAGHRVLVLVHRDELAEQAVTRLHSVDPSMSIGVVKAARNEADADVVVASVQTLAREVRRNEIRNVGLIIADECHRAASRTWVEVLEHYGAFDDRRTHTVGFTATMTRADGKGLGNIFESVCFERGIEFGIERGYLVDVRGQQVTVGDLNLADIARSRGDYQDGQLGSAMEAAGAGEIIARAYREHAMRPDGSFRRGVMFTPTVSSAYSFASDFRDAGIRAEAIDGTTSKEDRALIYKRYGAGEIDVISNALLLIEGWDSPATEVCVMARPTQSPGLFTQAVGRVLRPFPGKTEALVLDVVGATGHHRLQSLTSLTKVTVLDGESLAEAQARVAAEVEIVRGERIEAPHASREVELFANSHSVWLQTKAGVFFVPTALGVFFLWPVDGAWNLGYKSQKPRIDDRKPGWIYEGLTMEYAMAHGETLAEADDPTVSRRDRQWRKTKASQAQVDLAARLKIAPVEELVNYRRGALSDALSVHVASRMLDRFVLDDRAASA
jgi:superfamily II DNA or RNA helicase